MNLEKELHQINTRKQSYIALWTSLLTLILVVLSICFYDLPPRFLPLDDMPIIRTLQGTSYLLMFSTIVLLVMNVRRYLVIRQSVKNLALKAAVGLIVLVSLLVILDIYQRF